MTQLGAVVAVQRYDRGSSPRAASRVPGSGLSRGPTCRKDVLPVEVPPGRTDPTPSAQAKHAPSIEIPSLAGRRNGWKW